MKRKLLLAFYYHHLFGLFLGTHFFSFFYTATMDTATPGHCQLWLVPDLSPKTWSSSLCVNIGCYTIQTEISEQKLLPTVLQALFFPHHTSFPAFWGRHRHHLHTGIWQLPPFFSPFVTLSLPLSLFQISL
ncbi:hypothetical protein L1987_59554 [Smallanthus sonchifolius]|uniref:Uncharacterized protein n=1 Tax=Smallanthus sonchifolius TaxID=185202 RepID=A0ACB9D5W9_9ASTR|nr:hypothetical protein L1987_59554 [Smallanthus sonchifolius]